jgi:hypothetical protein
VILLGDRDFHAKSDCNGMALVFGLLLCALREPLLAESHLTRRLFGSMLRRIVAPPLPAG